MPEPVVFRTVAVLFGLAAAAVVTVFVTVDEAPAGVLVFAALFAACAAGLWLRAPWGRMLAMVVVLGNAAVGTLAAIAVIQVGTVPVVPAAFVVVNLVVLTALASVRGG